MGGSPIRAVAWSSPPPLTCSLPLLGYTMLLLAYPDPGLRAEEYMCAHSIGEATYPIVTNPGRSTTAASDTLRALLIFACHTDAKTGSHCGDETIVWTDSTAVPNWSSAVFEDADEEDLDDFDPEDEFSLTRYMYQMSDPDAPYIMLGRVYPSVVVPPRTIKSYDTVAPQGYMASNRDVIEIVDADTTFSFVDFDVDEPDDDNVDFVFIYYWSPVSADTTGDYRINRHLDDTWFGISDIFWGSMDVEGGTMTLIGADGATLLPRAKTCSSEVTRIRSLAYCVTLAAHEYVHDIFAAQWPPYGSQNVGHIGYGSLGLMSMRLSAPLMSGVMRYKFGWTEPVELDSTNFSGGVGDTSIVLHDCATNGSDGYLILRTHDEDQYFLLEARRENSTFTVRQPDDPGTSGCCQTDGTKNGLLVTHIYADADENCWSCDPGSPPVWDAELASGMFDVSGAPDPVAGQDTLSYLESKPLSPSPSFLFGPSPSTQTNVMGPWSNPSTNLYVSTTNDSQTVHSGWTIHDVEWAGGGTDSIRVGLSYRGSTAPAAADTLHDDMTWEGTVQLTGDLVVKSGVKLTVAEDTEVYAAAGKDGAADGLDTTRVEIVVDGSLAVEGTSGSEATFSSSRDNAFVHFRGAGETTDPAAGDWYGVRFVTVTESEQCDLEYPEFLYAHHAVELDSLSGTLFHPSFGNNDADVYLPYDVRIDVDAPWHLDGGTTVMAADTSAIDWAWGNAGLVDLVCQGKITAVGSSAAGDSVVFRPETITNPALSTAGDDWGGIILDMQSRGSEIAYADIGYAANPIFVYNPDSLTTIRNSRIHSFAETGVWVSSAKGQGAVVKDNLIERGSSLHEDLGTVGLFLDQADEMRVTDNEIDLSGLVYDAGGTGLSVLFGKTYCETAPIESDSLRIEGNEIIGTLDFTEGSNVGASFDWVCGDSLREVVFLENVVRRWNHRGLELIQDSDIQISCNIVDSTYRAVHVSRDSSASGVGMRFRGNRLEMLQPSGPVVRTDNSTKTRFGPEATMAANRGLNEIVRFHNESDDADFVWEDDATDDTMNAEDNYWYMSNGSSDSLVTDVDSVLAYIRPESGEPSEADVDVDPVETDDPEFSCYPGGGAGGGSAAAGQEKGQVGDRPRSPTTVLEGLTIPQASYLAQPRPNPTRSGVRVELGISVADAGPYAVRIYDVQGRRVAEVNRGVLVPGVHRLLWSGRDSRGLAVAPGVYFFRVEIAGHAWTRKILLMR